jgi:hypothetical protein
MDICEEIERQRDAGRVRCGIRELAAPSLADLAVEFELNAAASCYTEISGEAAQSIAVAILHRELAYGVEVVPEPTAIELAAEFLTACQSPGCRYYSNGNFSQSSLVSWMPATAATFDTGILVLGRERCGCLWVEDED